jgi:hypothetical protein
MCFGDLKGDGPTGLDADTKPARVASVTTTTTNERENQRKVSSVPNPKARIKEPKEDSETAPAPPSARRVDQFE